MIVDASKIQDVDALLKKAKWLEGKTLAQINQAIKATDKDSRVTTKGNVGHLIEEGFFGIKKNVESKPDIPNLGIEIKTCPLKYNKARDRLGVKEPLSLNIINYIVEDQIKSITKSSLYGKNQRILFILYIHDTKKNRSEYLIKYVFLWEMDDKVLEELRPDYDKIIKKIQDGLVHEIHQTEHRYLTICPKHSGKFKDPSCNKSKRKQPHSEKPAEVRAFRLKNRYMNLIISRHLGKKLEKGGWKVK